MHPTSLRGKCPICGQGPIMPFEIPDKLCVAKPGGLQVIGGVAAYQCRKELHVFFVMRRDIEAENPAASGYS